MNIDKEKWKNRLLKGGYYGAGGVLWVFYRITDIVGMGAIYVSDSGYLAFVHACPGVGVFLHVIGSRGSLGISAQSLADAGGDVLAVIFGVIIFQIMYRE